MKTQPEPSKPRYVKLYEWLSRFLFEVNNPGLIEHLTQLANDQEQKALKHQRQMEAVGQILNAVEPIPDLVDAIRGNDAKSSPEADAEARLLPCRCGNNAAVIRDSDFDLKFIAYCPNSSSYFGSPHSKDVWWIAQTENVIPMALDRLVAHWNAAAQQPVADAEPLYDERRLEPEEITCPVTDVIRTNGHDYPLTIAQYARNLACPVIRRTPRQPVTEPAAVAEPMPFAGRARPEGHCHMCGISLAAHVRPCLEDAPPFVCSNYVPTGVREYRKGTMSDFCQTCGQPQGYHGNEGGFEASAPVADACLVPERTEAEPLRWQSGSFDNQHPFWCADTKALNYCVARRDKNGAITGDETAHWTLTIRARLGKSEVVEHRPCDSLEDGKQLAAEHWAAASEAAQ